ncbi:MAG: adenylate/guanylate cyclase [Ignavibacteria bacterium]|nr:adenylate/guanylate cyclase [Ignavibacteria bacterium]
MTVYNFLVSASVASVFLIGLYTLFNVIVVQKKIGKHFYFFLWSVCCSLYSFFQLLLSLNWTNEQYLIFHKLKMFFGIWGWVVWFFMFYLILMPKAKNIIPYVTLIVACITSFFIPFDIFLSFPIESIVINTKLTPFVYHVGKTNLMYSIWGFIFILTIIITIIKFLKLTPSFRRNLFIFQLIASLLCVFNDFAISHRFIDSIMVFEINFFIFVVVVFMDFLIDERKTNLAVLDLSKQLSKEKDEAVRRLKITEIYTRHSLVESIERGDDPTKFESKNIQIATLFTDIRDFTGISEGMKPLEVVELLNAYFNRMNSTIIKHNGEIDKLMGDCIMALYKNPDDALKSAIEMRYELAIFNKGACSLVNSFDLEKGNLLPYNRTINNGIGLNYGEVIIGNIGSESKMDYTVVGDIVNTASRLEALTKYYKVPLIISEDLKNQLGKLSESSKLSESTALSESSELSESYNIRFLDEVLVKGKSNPMRIFEVFDFEPDEVKEIKGRNVEPLAEAFSYYQAGEFLKAIEIYSSDDFQSSDEFKDPVLHFFIERCRNLQIRKDAGLLKEWSGVFEFMDK